MPVRKPLRSGAIALRDTTNPRVRFILRAFDRCVEGAKRLDSPSVIDFFMVAVAMTGTTSGIRSSLMCRGWSAERVKTLLVAFLENCPTAYLAEAATAAKSEIDQLETLIADDEHERQQDAEAA